MLLNIKLIIFQNSIQTNSFRSRNTKILKQIKSVNENLNAMVKAATTNITSDVKKIRFNMQPQKSH